MAVEMINNEPYVCKKCKKKQAYWFWNIIRDCEGDEIGWRSNMTICIFCKKRKIYNNHIYKELRK